MCIVLQLVKESPILVVFFGDKTNSEVLASLEGIDDDLDGHEIPFVMSDNAELAGEFDIESFPALVAFQVSMAKNNFVQNVFLVCCSS